MWTEFQYVKGIPVCEVNSSMWSEFQYVKWIPVCEVNFSMSRLTAFQFEAEAVLFRLDFPLLFFSLWTRVSVIFGAPTGVDRSQNRKALSCTTSWYCTLNFSFSNTKRVMFNWWMRYLLMLSFISSLCVWNFAVFDTFLLVWHTRAHTRTHAHTHTRTFTFSYLSTRWLPGETVHLRAVNKQERTQDKKTDKKSLVR